MKKEGLTSFFDSFGVAFFHLWLLTRSLSLGHGTAPETFHNNSNTLDLVLELAGDEASTLEKQRSSLKWDRKKKKYVRVDDSSNATKKRKLRDESGNVINEAERGKWYVHRILSAIIVRL
jgi:hypothetical protein